MNSSSSPVRALAILPNWLGDLIMVAPALRCLRARTPLLSIGSPAALELLRHLGVIEAGLPYDRRGQDRGLGLWRIGRRAAAFGPKQAFAFGPSLRAAALAALSGARERIGYGGEGRRLFLNRMRPRMRRDRHLARQWLELVTSEANPATYLPLVASEAAVQRWQTLRSSIPELQGRAYVALAAGATYGVTKRWPHFEALARGLQQQCDLLPLFVGSADAEERRLCADLARRCEGIDLSGRSDLVQLSAMLAEAALCVGNDSGPAHLAAALGTPTLAIFGSSSPAWTAPLGPQAEFIGPAPIECSPCFAPTCTIGVRCLSELESDAVLERARALWLRRGVRA